MRNSFINWLCEKASADERIVFLTADLGYSVVEPFAKKYPNRFFNIGVAEQNMVGVAAGLASEGLRPYTYSIGVFSTFRCAEQLRNDIDYHNLPVCTSTVGCGLAYGPLGYSHHAIQDLALMRSLPNTILATPSDAFEVESILNWHHSSNLPIYLRMHKYGEPILHGTLPEISLSRPLRVRCNHLLSNKYFTDICILSIGNLTYRIKDYIEKYKAKIDLYSLPIWGSSSSSFKELEMILTNYEYVYVAEDHLLSGGLASWMLEQSIQRGLQPNIRSFSIDSLVVGKVASEETLLQSTVSSIESFISNF